jgi:hypothetical protein
MTGDAMVAAQRAGVSGRLLVLGAWSGIPRRRELAIMASRAKERSLRRRRRFGTPDPPLRMTASPLEQRA